MDLDNDVGLDGPPRFPNARTDLKCGDCGSPMQLIEGRAEWSPFYGCVRFPECRGSHGAHKDGKPKGKPADYATRQARKRAHELFDQIWKQRLVRNRVAAYEWMREAMGLPEGEAHIAMYDQAQCLALTKLVYRDYPSLRDRWSRLLFEDPFENA